MKEIKYEGIWGDLESKKRFPETITHKIFETNFSFHVNEHTTGKALFLFFKSFLLALTKLSFW